MCGPMSPQVHIRIRFYEELNDLLPVRLRKRDIECHVAAGATVRHVIESFGVPHTEVDLVLVNGEAAGFENRVCNADRVSVYPVFETLPLAGVTRLREQPLRETRFLCDAHLGKLARRLRLLGFDTELAEHGQDREIVERALSELRIVLTCARGLLMRKAVTRGILIRHGPIDGQVRRVIERLHLQGECRPFTRCTACNGLMRTLTAEDAALERYGMQIPDRVRQCCAEFFACEQCGKVYWEGSHFPRLQALVSRYVSGGDCPR